MDRSREVPRRSGQRGAGHVSGGESDRGQSGGDSCGCAWRVREIVIVRNRHFTEYWIVRVHLHLVFLCFILGWDVLYVHVQSWAV